jgi:hypothetical protein
VCRVCRASCHVWEEGEDNYCKVQSCRGLLYDLSLSLSAVTSYLLLILSVTGVTVNAFLEARAADLPNAAGPLISDGPAFGRKT